MQPTQQQKDSMAWAFRNFENATNVLYDRWLNFPSNGEAFMKDYPLAEGEMSSGGISFCDFAANVREWLKTSIDTLEKKEPLTFDEFRKGRTTYIPEQYEEVYGSGTIQEEDHSNIASVLTYEDGLHILLMRDSAKFSLTLENFDYLEYDLLELERKLYSYYLIDFDGKEAV